MQQKKQNFIEGAMILVAANLLIKVIGALYKIPLKNMIGSEGMGLFSYAYQIYNFMLIVATVGLPVALSKLVAESHALGKRREIRRIVGIGAAVFVPLGLICTLVLLVGAQPLAGLFGDENATAAVLAIAPSVLLVSVIAVFRGYYQGMSNMVPTAISQVIEALGKLLVGLALAFYAMRHGFALPLVAAFAILGVTIGEAVSMGYLICRTLLARRAQSPPELNESCRSNGTLLRLLLGLAVPVTVSNSIMSLTSLIDAGLLSNRLQDAGMTRTLATGIYGIYNSMPISLFNLPQTLIIALSMSVIPTIAAAFAAQNFTRVGRTIGTSLRLGALIALPCGAGFLALGGPILRLLFSADTEVATPMLQVLAFAVPCVAMVSLTGAILQGMGRADLSFYNMFFGALLKLGAEYVLVGHPHIMALGAPISTVLCYGLIAVLNFAQIGRLSQGKLPLGGLFGKPLAASIGMGAFAFIAHHVLGGIIGDKLACLLAIALSACLYAVLLLALQAISREDVLLLPKGEKIAALLHLKK